jgi:hypothetical protein
MAAEERNLGGAIGLVIDAFAITPHDTNELAKVTDGIYIGTDGDVVLYTGGGSGPITLKNCIAGTILWIRAKRVLATGTAATNLVGLLVR